jgi:hypothetical protein
LKERDAAGGGTGAVRLLASTEPPAPVRPADSRQAERQCPYPRKTRDAYAERKVRAPTQEQVSWNQATGPAPLRSTTSSGIFEPVNSGGEQLTTQGSHRPFGSLCPARPPGGAAPSPTDLTPNRVQRCLPRARRGRGQPRSRPRAARAGIGHGRQTAPRCARRRVGPRRWLAAGVHAV